MSKELTEQWRNGTLKEGLYWCEITESPYVEQVHLPCYDDIVVEVLAPVPTYSQFVDVSKKVKALKQQLTEANKILFNVWDCRDEREYYAELAKSYFEKYGAEK